jgi:hypothetical protein
MCVLQAASDEFDFRHCLLLLFLQKSDSSAGGAERMIRQMDLKQCHSGYFRLAPTAVGIECTQHW